MSALVEMRNLLVRRTGRTVLEIDRLDIPKGRVLALVGPNGAGKTTLLLVLARLLKPVHGDMRFKGKPVEKMHELDYRRNISLVMQEPLLLDMTAYDNIAVGLHFRHVAKDEINQRVETWGELLGIQHLRKRRGSTLSGGEAQRVALARAFVLKPDMLLLDEPFGALDKKTRSKLLEDLKNLLPETGATTIFSTHDEREVSALADLRIEMADGKIEAGDFAGN